jgi:hypothetical protein
MLAKIIITTRSDAIANLVADELQIAHSELGGEKCVPTLAADILPGEARTISLVPNAWASAQNFAHAIVKTTASAKEPPTSNREGKPWNSIASVTENCVGAERACRSGSIN